MSSTLVSLSSTAPAQPLDESAALAKQNSLLDALRRSTSLLVAFSGGADSAYLAWAADCALGERSLSVTALSASFSRYDREHAEAFVRAHSLRHEFIETREFANPLYVANSGDRCFHCKDELFVRMESLARARGFSAIAYGVNADDTRDFRPGHRAAHNHRVLSPLLDAGLSKNEIRLLSRYAGLETWDRPASPCLSSRVPYGTSVTLDLLSRIERAEDAVRRLGFRQFRVRATEGRARIEIASDELARALPPEMSARLVAAVKSAGFPGAFVDPAGYCQGSLNAALAK